jgi:hypothetical protein
MNKKAPPTIPENLLKAFTLDGKMHLKENYVDEAEANLNRIYSKELIENELRKVEDLISGTYTLDTAQWLMEAFKKHSITDEDVLVIGSQIPFYEAVCLKCGGCPVTVEFNPIKSEDPNLRTMTVNELEQSDQVYNRALSISTHEHTGLGRYGDDLDPEGDFKALALLQTKMKPGGLLYLSVPIGHDVLVWNTHRIYGPIRLPMLLKGWELIESFGYDPDRKSSNIEEWYQPIFVLRKP